MSRRYEDFDEFCDPANPKVIQYDSVVEALKHVRDFMPPTPCLISHYQRESGINIYYKLETIQKTGSFKERGAVNALRMLSKDKQKIGVVVASLGNQAMGICYYGQKLSIPVTVIMPTCVPVNKLQLCHNMGAKVIVQGNNLYESQKVARAYAREKGLTHINARDHPHILSGYGTIALEILEQVPCLDAVMVAVGTGGLAAAVATVIKHVKPDCLVYGVQSERLPTFYKSLEAGEPVNLPYEPSIAESIAMPYVGINSFHNAQPLLDKMLLVKEDWIARAILHLAEMERLVVEGAGACPLAAILGSLVPELKSKNVVCVLSGGNIDAVMLGRSLDRGLAAEGRLIKFKVYIPDFATSYEQLARLVANGGYNLIRQFQDRIWVENEIYRVEKYTVKNISRSKRVKTKLDMETKCREDPVVMKLDTPEFHNIFSNEVLDLKKIFDKYQYEIRIAGGAVRDLLLGQQAKDLDFATTATPQQMKEMFTTENVRMINLSGEKHGTITPRINDKENFEVTTLRIDMITDGRHAEVEFTKDWKLDANRRDLTINSMFLGFDGSVYDYFYGFDDLQKRRIAFVGDPDVRIKEDYLRIMRYFRFYGRIATTCDNHDEYTLNIIKNNADGLQNVSGERIWMELKKILQGNFAGDLLKTMLSVNIGQYIGIPKCNMTELDSLLKRSKPFNLHPMSYLAALLDNIDDVTVLHNRLKFSSYDRDMAYFLVENRNEKTGSRPLIPYEKLVLNTKIKQKDAMDYVKEVLTYRGDEKLLNEFNNWEIPKFPVNGKILKESGVPPGKMYGPIITKLKDLWIENEYKHTTEDLVKIIPSVVEEFKRK